MAGGVFNRIAGSYYKGHKMSADTLGSASTKVKRNKGKGGASIQDAYQKGYRMGLTGRRNMEQATYRDQAKVDAYAKGLERGLKEHRGY